MGNDAERTSETTISSQYAITLRVDYTREAARIAKVAATIGEQGGVIQAIDPVHIQGRRSVRDYTVECASTEHAQRIIDAIRAIEDLVLESVSDDTFLMHLGGKLEIHSKVALKTRSDLSMACTPGVARVCKAIEADPKISHALTIPRNSVTVVSDGSAVLGRGNIGPEAAMPVMEGKAIAFKKFAGVDAFPLCLDTQDPDEIIFICKAIAPPSEPSTSRTSRRPAASPSSSSWRSSSTSRCSTTISTARPSPSWPPHSTRSGSRGRSPRT